MLSHRKTFLDQLPLIALLVITSAALGGVYYLWAHPAGQGLSVNVNGVTIQNPYYYGSGELPDLDNCPGGPNAEPCIDEFGIQISCYNPNQDDEDFDRIGDLCDPNLTPVVVTCTPDGCNSSCPAACTAADDPDCPDPAAAICCGDSACEGTETSVNCPADCTAPPVCTPDGCNSSCPAACTAADDPDCPDPAAAICCGDSACEGTETSVNCPADCTLLAYCGDGTVHRPNGSGDNEQCEFDASGKTTLAGDTTGDWGSINYHDFQRNEGGCVACGTPGGGQACQTVNYRNCANFPGVSSIWSLPETRFAWVVKSNYWTNNATIAQIAARPDAGYSIGDTVNEYQICKGSGPDSYLIHDYKINGTCTGDRIVSLIDLAVNLELNETWLVSMEVAGVPEDTYGVAFISDRIKKFCPMRESATSFFWPTAIAVDRAGDAWVVGTWRVGSYPAITVQSQLRRYSPSSISTCQYQAADLPASVSSGDKLAVAPNGSLWLLNNTDGGNASQPYRLTYIPDPSSFMLTAQPGDTVPNLKSTGSLYSWQPRDLLVEADGSVLIVNKLQDLKKYRYNSGTNQIDLVGYLVPPSFRADAITFWPDQTGNLDNFLWAANWDGSETKLFLLKRPGDTTVTKTTNFPAVYQAGQLSASSDGAVWSTLRNHASLIRCSGLDTGSPSCITFPFSGWTNAYSGYDFLGLKRSITLGANVLYYPALNEGPLTAFDIDAADPNNATWYRRWGKVMYTLGGSGSVEVYVCFSDSPADVNDPTCPGGNDGAGWVAAADYNAALNSPQYQKRYLRIKAVKEPLATISDLEIGCTDAAGALVCPAP